MINSKIPCALLGTGRQASRLLNVFRKTDFDFKALLSRGRDKSHLFLKEHVVDAEPIITNSLEELLKVKKLDSVFIATPDVTHYKYAYEALEDDKNVYLEKPISLKISDGLSLLNTAIKHNKVLFIGYHLRGVEILRYLRDLIRNDYFGNIKQINIGWRYMPHSSGDWRNEEGAWWCSSMVATHCLDLLLWFFGWDCIIKYEGKLSNNLYHSNDDKCEINLTLKKHITAIVQCSLDMHQSLTVKISSDRGEITLNNLLDENAHIEFPGHNRIEFSYTNPWETRVRAFHDCIKNKKPFYNQLFASLVNVFIFESLYNDFLKAHPNNLSLSLLYNTLNNICDAQVGSSLCDEKTDGEV